MADVRIVMTGHGRGEVFIDGHKVDGVRAVSIKAAVDAINEMTLELVPSRIEVEGVFDVSNIESEAREYRDVRLPRF